MSRRFATLLAIAVLSLGVPRSEARAGDVLETREGLGLFIVAAGISSSSLVFFIGNSVHLGDGVRPNEAWSVGGLTSGISASFIGTVELFLAWLTIELDEIPGLDTEDLAWIVSGSTALLTGLLTTGFTIGAMRLPRVSRLRSIDPKPFGEDNPWSLYVVPAVLSVDGAPVPALALAASW